MPIYHRTDTNSKPILYFWGDLKSWDNLIVKNCKSAANIYVCDQSASKKFYPKEIKLIRSKDTMKRVLRGADLGKAAVFINASNFNKAQDFVAPAYYHRFQYLIIYVGTNEVLYLLRHNSIEKNSRRNIIHLRKYK